MRAFPSVLAAFALAQAGLSCAAISSAPPADESHGCLLVSTKLTLRDGATASGNGTCFLADKDLVVTCNHLLRIPTPMGVLDAQQVHVQTGPDKFTRARIVAKDVPHDLALLRLDQPIDQCAALPIQPFGMQRNSSVRIVGNFPDRVRNTRGKILQPQLMDGFAMSNAKVYSGFSGGPILDDNGIVQGILSQRDDDNNSIFVRSDIVLGMLRNYADRESRTIACLEARDSKDSKTIDTPVDAALDKAKSVAPSSEVAALPIRSKATRAAAARYDSAGARLAPAAVVFPKPEVELATAKTTKTRKPADDTEVVVVFPVRKSSTHYTSQNAR